MTLIYFILFFEIGSHFIAWADLKLVILLSLPPQGWDYRGVAPQLADLGYFLMLSCGGYCDIY
jgi:hypothetical protein